MQEVLELVCRKRRLPNPRDYALLLGDKSLLIPLDRTVASLQGKSELVLVKRSVLPALGIDVTRGTQKTTDPNGKPLRCPSLSSFPTPMNAPPLPPSFEKASIFKRMSEVPEVQTSPLDYTAAYKVRDDELNDDTRRTHPPTEIHHIPKVAHDGDSPGAHPGYRWLLHPRSHPPPFLHSR